MTFQTILYGAKEKKAFTKNPNKIQCLKKLQIYHLNLNRLGENSETVSIAVWLWKTFPVNKHYLT